MKWEQLPFLKIGINDFVITGIVCNECLNILPPHTGAEHLDPDHSIHKCPHHGVVE